MDEDNLYKYVLYYYNFYRQNIGSAKRYVRKEVEVLFRTMVYTAINDSKKEDFLNYEPVLFEQHLEKVKIFLPQDIAARMFLLLHVGSINHLQQQYST